MKLLATLGSAVILFSTIAAGGQPPRFLVTPIDHRPPRIGDWDDDHIDPTGMNDLGQVVGTGESQGESLPMWVWSAGVGVRSYGSGGELGIPMDINNAGQVVLTSGPGPSIWTAAAGRQPLAAAEYVSAINNSGVVVGASYIHSGQDYRTQAAYWPTPDNVQLIAKLPGRPGPTWAEAINDRGDVVGDSWPTAESPNHRAFLRTAKGALIDLGTLPGQTDSYAWGVNNRTHVIGYSRVGVATPRGFLWTPERGMQDLEDVTGAAMTPVATNDAGVIVGNSIEFGRAVYYWSPHDGLFELDALLDPSASGWRIGKVMALNDAGQVLVESSNRGRYSDPTYLLLTPVPEPAGTAVVLACLALLAARRRGRSCPLEQRHLPMERRRAEPL